MHESLKTMPWIATIVLMVLCGVAGQATEAAGAGDLKVGKPRLMIGDFIYSREFDLQQNADRNTPIIMAKHGLVRMFGSARDPKVTDNDQAATMMTKKADVLREMATTRAVRTGQFDIIERTRLNEIKGEIGFDKDSNFDPKSLAERGRLAGADYIVFGSITKFSKDQHNVAQGKQFRKNTYWLDMTIELRIVEVKTGSIKIADTVTPSVECTKESEGSTSEGMSKEETGAMGDLMGAAADAIIAKVTTTLRPIVVIDTSVDEGLVTINYGEGIVAKGQRFSVFLLGDQIKDPYTGETVGNREKKIGEIVAAEVMPRMTKCRVVDPADEKSSVFAVGMICRAVMDNSAGAPITKRLRESTKEDAKPARPGF